jgi:hypothetical protein
MNPAADHQHVVGGTVEAGQVTWTHDAFIKDATGNW